MDFTDSETVVFEVAISLYLYCLLFQARHDCDQECFESAPHFQTLLLPNPQLGICDNLRYPESLQTALHRNILA